ncbi:MAG: hypothetical protein QW835_02385 [Candidatus Hadarchaeum sp.]|uniref:hypothetical protein n=1 Tax=Candidatus Hadarchaeum sp. TaxID=2883567 RepID=UPI00316E7E11
MLLTTSRRPCHLARVLGRELARFLPGSEYIPRGVKTIEKIVFLAKQRGHDRVMIISSLLDKPGEIRFIEVRETWRWMDATIRLAGVTVSRVKTKFGRLGKIRIYAEDASSLEFARWLGKILGIDRVERTPESGPIILITSKDGLKIKFGVMPDAEDVGPVLLVSSFGPLFKRLGDVGGSS